MQELKIYGTYKHFKGDYYLVENVEQVYRFELQNIESKVR